jgi:hypothetical protein
MSFDGSTRDVALKQNFRLYTFGPGNVAYGSQGNKTVAIALAGKKSGQVIASSTTKIFTDDERAYVIRTEDSLLTRKEISSSTDTDEYENLIPYVDENGKKLPTPQPFIEYSVTAKGYSISSTNNQYWSIDVNDNKNYFGWPEVFEAENNSGAFQINIGPGTPESNYKTKTMPTIGHLTFDGGVSWKSLPDHSWLSDSSREGTVIIRDPNNGKVDITLADFNDSTDKTTPPVPTTT